MQNKDGEASLKTYTYEAVEHVSSLPQRIGASASGLLQSAFETTSASAFTETLASLDIETAKGGSSSSGNHNDQALASAQSFIIRKDQSTERSMSAGETFRSRQMQSVSCKETVQAAFDQFAVGPQQNCNAVSTQQASPASDDRRRVGSAETYVVDYNLLATFNSILRRGQASEKVAAAQADEKIFQVLSEDQRDSGHPSGLFDDLKENDDDGAEVVALLSDPTSFADDDPADLSDQSFDESDFSNVHRVKSHCQSSPDMSSASQLDLDPLGLVPDFEHFVTSTVDEPKDHCSNLKETGFQDFGDIQPWITMLNKYHDEVWGDALPLVQEAREQIRVATISQEGEPQNRPAIRRLGMLLRHLNLPVP